MHTSRLSRFLSGLAGGVLFSACILHAAPSPGPTPTHTEAGNLYLAGGNLQVNDKVNGDLFAVGGQLQVAGPVMADAALSGGSIRIQESIGQDLRVAGGNIELSAPVGGDMLAAGGKVHISRETTVGGDSVLAGGDVTVAGTLHHGARIYANRVTIDGLVRGNTRLYAEEIIFTPAARIEGDLEYASPRQLSAEAHSKVTGNIKRDDPGEAWGQERRPNPVAGFHPLFILSMYACGILLYYLFPGAVEGVRQNITDAPFKSIGFGLALLFTLPPVAVLLIATLVGIPLGIGLFALYPVLLILGYLATAFLVSHWLARIVRKDPQVSRRRQLIYFAGALLILGLVGIIPVLGWAVVFLGLVGGIGGWATWGLQRYRSTRAHGLA